VAKNFSPEQTDLLRQSLKYATLSQDVYNVSAEQAPSGWKIVADSALSEEWKGGFFARIYEKDGPVAPGEPRYVIAFRGTDDFIKDKKNREADLQIAFWKLPGQYNQAEAFVKDFFDRNKIKPDEVAFTGHSLGGYLAITVGMALGVDKIWTFSSPGPTKGIRDQLTRKIPGLSKPPCKGLVQIRSAYDVIARWQYPEGKIIDVETSGGNHSLGILKEGIEAAVSGRQLPPGPGVRGELASIFNELSKRLALSGTAEKLINKIFGKNKPRPPDCKCA
jgi:hypothetical protein